MSPPLRRLLSVALLTTTLDLASKAWAERVLAHGPRVVWPHRLNLLLSRNPHGAMGFLSSVPEGPRRALLVGAALLAVVAAVAIGRRLRRNDHLALHGLALILGGAIGNAVDRLRGGAVIDFLDVVISRSGGVERHWHTFNVADVAICVGVALLGFDALRGRRPASLPVSSLT